MTYAQPNLPLQVTSFGIGTGHSGVSSNHMVQNDNYGTPIAVFSGFDGIYPGNVYGLIENHGSTTFALTAVTDDDISDYSKTWSAGASGLLDWRTRDRQAYDDIDAGSSQTYDNTLMYIGQHSSASVVIPDIAPAEKREFILDVPSPQKFGNIASLTTGKFAKKYLMFFLAAEAPGAAHNGTITLINYFGQLDPVSASTPLAFKGGPAA